MNLLIRNIFTITSICGLVFGCQRSKDSYSVLSPTQGHVKSLVEEEGGFKEIYAKVMGFGGDIVQNLKNQIELWPHSKNLYPAFSTMSAAIYKQINDETKQIVDKDVVFSKIRNIADEHRLSVYLAGMSASRVAYLATLSVRRKNGDNRISPYRVGHHFDEMFPFKDSTMELVVDGGTAETHTSFTSNLKNLLNPIIQISVETALEYDKRKENLKNSCSQAIIPLNTNLWDPQQLGTLPYVFNHGVLNEGVPSKKWSYDDFVEILTCLSLFDLTAPKDVEAKLRDFVAQIKEPFEISPRSQRNTYAMLWEMRHIYRFRPFLKSLEWDKQILVESYQKIKDENLRNNIVQMMDKKPMTLGYGGLPDSLRPMSFGQLTQKIEEQLYFNHSTQTPEQLLAVKRNPYGLPNTYVSRPNSSKYPGNPREGAMAGEALYALPQWKRTYSGQSLHFISTPRTPFWGKNCRTIWASSSSGTVPYALTNFASYFYVVDPRTRDDAFVKENLDKNISGILAIGRRFVNTPWQRQFIFEGLFANDVRKAEGLATFLYSYSPSAFAKNPLSYYFDCKSETNNQSSCRVRSDFAKYFQQAQRKNFSSEKRPILRSKPGVHPTQFNAKVL